MAHQISFTSLSGVTVNFSVHPKQTAWPSAGGLYMFVKAPAILASEPWRAIYVGQTSSLIERLPEHERWLEAVGDGATHVAVCLVPRPDQRDALERELITFTQAPLNTMLKANRLAALIGQRGLLGMRPQ